MEFVEPEDEPQPYRSPLPPDDRVWRHPSEVGLMRAPSTSRRQLWAVGVMSALAASLLSTGLAVVAGSLLDQGNGTGTLRSTVLPGPTAVRDGVVDVAERLRPAIVQLKVDKGRTGSGSGVIFRSDGHILTNAHVIEGGTTVTVVLSNGRELEASVIGSDAASDTAVVKIDDGPYPVARLGTTAELKVGQQAVAIGSPLGLAGGPSVTAGVVSALHRTVRSRTSAQALADMIQTDAPIAPGSSGGALLDSQGAVIGITTAVAITDTGNEGFGFAIPIDAARFAADQLISAGKVTNVWMGVECSDLDGVTAVDLNVPGGTMVDGIRAGSPAEHAGLAARDVIVAINGRAVTSVGMLMVMLREHPPGDVVSIDVVRDRAHRTMAVTIAERPPGS
jgi:serine protease Do